MIRSWEMIPLRRIDTDINRWEMALGMTFYAQGAVVPELNNRHGRRAQKFVPHADCAESVRVKEEKYATYVQYTTVALPA
eukprot:1574879-Prymnesium_polylepis.1